MLVATDRNQSNYIPGVLEHETQYYWKVVARDRSNATTSGPIWTFTTELCDNDPPNKPEQPSGPTRARNRYNYSAKIAKKEGYEIISQVFSVTAEQEKVHAKRIFEHLQELKSNSKPKFDELTIETVVPTLYGNTKTNLESAIAGEKYEHTTMYPDFAQTALDEGLTDIATRFKSIAKAEEHHEERYQKLLDQLNNNTIFKKSKKVWWVCMECGYVHHGTQPPTKCPSCDHPQSYYRFKCEQY